MDLRPASVRSGLIARERSIAPRNRIFSQNFIYQLESLVSGSEVLGLVDDVIGHQFNEDVSPRSATDVADCVEAGSKRYWYVEIGK